MITSKLRFALLLALPTLVVCGARAPRVQDKPAPAESAAEEEVALHVHFLEIVTPDVDATCRALEEIHGVSFGEPVAVFGNARTAALEGGGRVSVRAPMRATEEPVVRPYVLVDDLEGAVEAAAAAGGEIAMPPTEIPGEGGFAIYIQGGIQHGLWQK